MIRALGLLCIGVMWLGCVSPASTFEKVPPGIWRGVLLLDRSPVSAYGDDRDIVKKFDSESELPFNFEVVYSDDTTFHIVIYNGKERIEVKDVTFGRDKATAKDTVIISFPLYDTYIKAILDDGVMEGDWIVNYKDNYAIPFKAVHGNGNRFDRLSNKEPVSISGRWATKFELDTPDEYPAVGIFDQKGDTLTGTFLTETGDYRYLEGKVVEDKLYLSTFDGAHAYMFIGKILPDSSLVGTFRSGNSYKTNWSAVRDENASLTDRFTLTSAKDASALKLALPNTEGRIIDIDTGKYKGKAKLIQIMGTWCPNCMDETLFLIDFFKNNDYKDLEWISVGFERYKDSTKAMKILKEFKNNLKLDNEVLYGGYYDKKSAALIFPQLDKLMAYPTLLFLDKNNKIVNIHTGFSGPATTEFNKFKDEFPSLVNELIK